MTGWRHNSLGQIDRSKPIRFRFDGSELEGFDGDTIASALLASGVRVVGRSFKYHRPRGIFSAGNEDPNAIVDVTLDGSTTPNLRATTEKLRDGMSVASVNTSPNALTDNKRFIDWVQRFLPAGFYYKTFMLPGWMRWEPMIRNMAGLGSLDRNNHPPAIVPQINATCEVLVVGAGPAGLAAARSAVEAGDKVWLVDDGEELGGSLRWLGGEINQAPWEDYVRDTVEIIKNSGGCVLTHTVLWGAFDHGLYAAWDRGYPEKGRQWRIRAERVILAAGAIERPLWFANNDLPGVMLAESGLNYAKNYGAIAGRKIVLATGNNRSYAVAQGLSEAGADVILADARDKSDCPAESGDFETRYTATVQAASGRNGVSRVSFRDGNVEADCLLVSGGYTPSVHLWCQAGGKLDWDVKGDVLVPRGNMNRMQVVGAANGCFDLDAALAEGHQAGGGTGHAPKSQGQVKYHSTQMRPDRELKGRQWIDFQNDVTLKDVALADREGFRSVEHLKRYTTLGMATDQGKTSNFAGLAAMSTLTGRTIPETGTTTYRPPFEPVPLNSISGRRRANLFNPVKRLSLENVYREAGAQFREYGGWLRPSVYGTGDQAKLAQSEAYCARKSVGLYDASPLGKIEVLGPRAAELLDFTNYVRMSTLKPGRARYGFMLSESGVVFDDGVVMRIDDDRFIVSASSSHVEGVRMILEEIRQDRFGSNGAVTQDVTSNWTTFSVTGPRAAELLKSAGISLPALSHMDVIELEQDGIPMRIARISFTGDMSYEISVPSRYGRDLDSRLASGLGVLQGSRIGLEAVMILRAEKGYILVGKDTDGITMPHDLGWVGPREKRLDEYQGKRSLFTDEATRNDRRELVGLEGSDGDNPIPTGAHLIPGNEARRSLGFVTSSYFSEYLNRPIALALLESGLSQIGEQITWFDNGRTGTATVSSACFFDSNGGRLNG